MLNEFNILTSSFAFLKLLSGGTGSFQLLALALQLASLMGLQLEAFDSSFSSPINFE